MTQSLSDSLPNSFNEDLPFGLRAGKKLPAGLMAEIRSAILLARDFNREVARPCSLDVDLRVQNDPDYLPLDLVFAAQERAFFSLWLPKAFGGGGYSPLSMLAFSEELASECLGIANLIGSHYVGFTLISATYNLKILRQLCRDVIECEKKGEPCLVATAITEPDAGTDMEDIELLDRGRVRCRAEKVPGGYRIHGTKVFISNASMSAWVVVTAYADLAKPSENTVVLLVKSGSPGFKLGRIERKMGQNACPASVLLFDGCFVPDEQVCLAPTVSTGPASYREFCAMLGDDVLAMSRPGVAAMAAGAGRGAYREALTHCLQTQVRGSLMANQEWAQCLLAEIYKNVRLSQLCVWEAGLEVGLNGPFKALLHRFVFSLLKFLPLRTAQSLLGGLLAHPFGRARLLSDRARLRKTGQDGGYSAHASLAKFAASDLAMDCCRIALQLMGQAGFRHENRVEKILRDVKLLQIYEGTNQLNRINLFKHRIAPGTISVFNE